MSKQLLMAVFLLLLLKILCSCRGSEGEPEINPQPVQTRHGDFVGPSISQTIGQEGGSISMPDGSIMLEIPEGAVVSPTNFTIQEVTPTLESATGRTYRLGPEDIAFQKDVRLTFTYTDEDLAGTGANELYLVYQDPEGYWHRVIETDIDEAGKKLTVRTRHFSDWAIERIFYIKNLDKGQLLAGEECDMIAYASDIDENGNLLMNIPVPNKNIDTWFVHGSGTLNRYNMESVTYKAPSSISSPQSVAVGLRIKNMVDKRNPDRPGNAGLAIVQIPLELLPDEYFTWQADGITHTGLSYDAVRLGATTQLIGTALTGGMSLTVNASKAGSYELGNTANPDAFGIQLFLSRQNDVIYQGEYRGCGETVPRYGKGKLTITRFGNVGERIEGYFTATVYNMGPNCVNTSKQVTGKFRIRRML